MKSCFMGLGYIGLPTAVIAAKHGIEVVGVDINPQVVEMTNKGQLHIVEPGLEAYLQEVVTNGKLKASIKPEVSDAYFMVVPTPFKGNYEPDISYVETATRVTIPLLVSIYPNLLAREHRTIVGPGVCPERCHHREISCIGSSLRSEVKADGRL